MSTIILLRHLAHNEKHYKKYILTAAIRLIHLVSECASLKLPNAIGEKGDKVHNKSNRLCG